MAKINFNSINVRLIVSFLSLAVVMVLLVVITIGQMATIVKLGTEVMYFNQPTRMYSYALNSGVRESNLALSNYLLTQDSKFKDARAAIWQTEIAAAMDSLRFYEQHWKAADDIVLLNKISRSLEKINEKQEEIEKEVRRGSSASSNIDIWDYPNLEGDTLVIDSEFEDWLSEQSSAGSDPNANLKQKMIQELQPLSADLSKQTETLFQSFRASALREAELINSKVARFAIITIFMIIGSLLIAYLFFRYVKDKVIRSIGLVQQEVQILGAGNLPEEQYHTNDELEVVLDEIHQLSANLANVKSFALEVGKGQFDNDIAVFNNEGEIGSSLAEMRESLKKVAEEDRIRNWANRGYAEFGDILRKNSDDLDQMADAVIRQMVKYINANQGGFFILNENEGENALELKSSFAYDRKKFIDKVVHEGQGLVGQCYLEKESIYLKEVPENYVVITSGLGKAAPNYIFVVPLIFNEKVYGIIELASFNAFEDHVRVFIERQAESIASTISNVKINQNTRKLLEESQQLTEQMRSQEEEMRQNMEELQATQEEVHRNQQEMVAKTGQLNSIIKGISAVVITTDQSGKISFANDAALQLLNTSEQALNGRHIAGLLPDAAGITEKGGTYSLIGAKGEEIPCLAAVKASELEGQSINTYTLTPLSDTAGANNQAEVKALLEKEQNLLKQIADLKQELESASQKASNSGDENLKNYAKEINARLKEKLLENEKILREEIEKQKRNLGL